MGIKRSQKVFENMVENSIESIAKHNSAKVMTILLPEKRGIILSPLSGNSSIEIVFILEGELYYQDGEERVVLKSGDLIHHSSLEKEITVYSSKDTKLIVFSNNSDSEEVKEWYTDLCLLVNEVNEKDNYTKNHCLRVGIYAQKLASYYGDEHIGIKDLMMAANIHDVGKCKIPDEILLKPGRFNDEERNIMNMHSEFTYDILKSQSTLKETVSMIAACHHERYDGTGYPYGLKGTEIPIESRIIGIVDTFDAMTTTRPYQKARSNIEAITEMEKFSHQFDPKLFKLFKRLVEERVIHQGDLPSELTENNIICNIEVETK